MNNALDSRRGPREFPHTTDPKILQEIERVKELDALLATQHKSYTNSALKPCPFCGGEARLENVYGQNGIEWYCRCVNNCVGKVYQTTQLAIDMWNTRVSKED